MKLIYCSCLTECQNLESTWLEIARNFMNTKTKVGIVMARVDCSKEPLLCAGTMLSFHSVYTYIYTYLYRKHYIYLLYIYIRLYKLYAVYYMLFTISIIAINQF